jgi:hypothetical protein
VSCETDPVRLAHRRSLRGSQPTSILITQLLGKLKEERIAELEPRAVIAAQPSFCQQASRIQYKASSNGFRVSGEIQFISESEVEEKN